MTTRNARLQHDFVTGFHPCDQITDFTHDPGNIVPENVRQRNLDPRQAAAHPHVEMIQRTGTHFDQDFVGFDLGISDLSELENCRAAVLFEDDSLHYKEDICGSYFNSTSTNSRRV